MKIGKSHNTELRTVQGNIIEQSVDVIVNAANEEMAGGGGVDGVIHCAAGWDILCIAAKKAMAEKGWEYVPTGQSIITGSYGLSPSGIKYIVHTVGPIQDEHKNRCLPLLESCFKTSLALAEQQGDASSIAYPLISTGIFGVPVQTFAQAARNVLPTYPFKRILSVSLVVYRDPVAERTLRTTLRMQ